MDPDNRRRCRASSTTSTSSSCRRLRETLNLADRADFCVGYFNLRGWKQLDSLRRAMGGRRRATAAGCSSGCSACPQDELRAALSLVKSRRRHRQPDGPPPEEEARRGVPRPAHGRRPDRTKTRPACAGWPPRSRPGRSSSSCSFATRCTPSSICSSGPIPINPNVGYLGSSNLTFAGLSHQGELNVDVLDHDACSKLAKWFEDRWNDRWCIDISEELVEIIEESWAREELDPALPHLPQDGLPPVRRRPGPA